MQKSVDCTSHSPTHCFVQNLGNFCEILGILNSSLGNFQSTFVGTLVLAYLCNLHFKCARSTQRSVGPQMKCARSRLQTLQPSGRLSIWVICISNVRVAHSATQAHNEMCQEQAGYRQAINLCFQMCEQHLTQHRPRKEMCYCLAQLCNLH